MPSLERMGPRSFSVNPDDKITGGSCDCILQYPTEASDKFFASRKLRLCVKVHCIKNFSAMALARKLLPSSSCRTLGSLILKNQICGYSRPRQGALSSLSVFLRNIFPARRGSDLVAAAHSRRPRPSTCAALYEENTPVLPKRGGLEPFYHGS